MLVVACVAIIVVGPKDLPKMLRAFGKTLKSVRGLASDFQKQFDDAIREAELDDVKNIASGKKFSPLEDIKKSVTSYEKDVKEQMSAKAREMDEALGAKPGGLPQPVADKLGIDTGKPKAEIEAKPATAEKAAAESASGKAASKKETPARKSAGSATGKTAKKAPAAKTAAKKATAGKTAVKAAKNA